MTEINLIQFEIVPKSKLEILDQEISDERGLYRVRAGDRVHYLTMPITVFDEDTMGKPLLLIPQLPDFPDTNWIRMNFPARKRDIGAFRLLLDSSEAQIHLSRNSSRLPLPSKDKSASSRRS